MGNDIPKAHLLILRRMAHTMDRLDILYHSKGMACTNKKNQEEAAAMLNFTGNSSAHKE